MATYTQIFRPAASTVRAATRLLLASLMTILLAFTPQRAVGQNAADLVAQGDRESAARQAAAALGRYEQALQQDPRAATILWRAAREAVDLGEFEANERVRTALYTKAADYARRAVAAAPSDPDAHFHLSRALGRTALALGPRDRVKYGIEVRASALRALELQPRHAGALHVMGVWHAEVMRLNGLARTVARAFLGGQVFGTASWQEATRALEGAVAIEPNRIVHRLDLARIYRDTKRSAEAQATYQAALGLALIDANDATYRQQVDRELRELRGAR